MPLLSFADAKSALLAAARPIPESETIDLADASGRVLADDLRSPIDVPGFDNTAMDGYAVRAADVASAGTRLPVSQRIAAGSFPEALPPASAARIFTGAPLPAGADAVVMQEDCREADGIVTIDAPPPTGQHVRRAGSDIARDSIALPAGTRLSAAALGLASSIGIARVRVRRRLKVAIFFTGSELVMPGTPLAAGQIYNSNRYVLRGFLREAGAEVIDLGIVRDDLAATRAALREAAHEADLILTSGGMSEGEEDHVKPAVEAEGRIDVWKIAAKPGKPLAFGDVTSGGRSVAFVGLPGNPVSVWAGLLTLVRPFLRAMEGDRELEPPLLKLRADFDYTVKGNRLEFVRVRRNTDGGLDIFRTQDSAVLSSAVWADGVAPLPAGTTVRPGDLVDYLPGPPR
ncbi:MAG TPA: gephyrin-like molybdotransferase Glp [Rhodocyclaceae bacterium]